MAGTRQHESAVDRIRDRVEEKAARRAAARAAADGAAAASERPSDAPPQDAPDDRTLPGVNATRPTKIPLRGWVQIVKRAWAENNADNMPIIGAGVAFFGFLAIL